MYAKLPKRRTAIPISVFGEGKLRLETRADEERARECPECIRSFDLTLLPAPAAAAAATKQKTKYWKLARFRKLFCFALSSVLFGVFRGLGVGFGTVGDAFHSGSIAEADCPSNHTYS